MTIINIRQKVKVYKGIITLFLSRSIHISFDDNFVTRFLGVLLFLIGSYNAWVFNKVYARTYHTPYLTFSQRLLIKKIANIDVLKFDLLPPAPYLLDLTFSDCFLFPNLKNGSEVENLSTMKRSSQRLGLRLFDGLGAGVSSTTAVNPHSQLLVAILRNSKFFTINKGYQRHWEVCIEIKRVLRTFQNFFLCQVGNWNYPRNS